MKRVFLALAAVAPLIAVAQATDVLIEACNAISEPARRLECLKAAIGAQAAPAKKDQLEPVRRAFGNMQSSLDVGVSYNNYQLAILELARTVSAFKQDAGEDGLESASHFDAALQAYSDAGTFWERAISFYARQDNNISYGGGLPIKLNGMEWLVSKYSLTTSRADLLGFHSGLPVQQTRAMIWRIARERAEQGFSSSQKNSLKEISEQLVLSYAATGDQPERDVSERMAKGSACSSSPSLVLTVDAPNKKEFLTRCVDGTTLKIVCAEGSCKGELSR